MTAVFIGSLTVGISAGFQAIQKTAQTSAEFAPKPGQEYTSEMRPLLEWFSADRVNLQRFYDVEGSAAREQRMRRFYENWLARLSQLNFDSFGQAGKIDYIVFRNSLEHELRGLKITEQQDAADEPFLPFASTIRELEVNRQEMKPLNSRDAAKTLADLGKEIEAVQKSVEGQVRQGGNAEAARERKIHVAHAVSTATALRNSLRTWFTFYNGYDPEFTWWAAEDYRRTDTALQNYIAFLRERVLGLKAQPAEGQGQQAAGGARQGAGGGRAGGNGGFGAGGRGGATPVTTAQAGDTADIIGNPVGRAALMSELEYEMIPYTPEQLIAIANKEFAWCENEMRRASQEMGYGDDWKKALEKVKNMYVEPGKQPELIRRLALEAIQFMHDYDLVTIPPIARETWRMQMMTPQRQLVNPFFTGGEVISVSYPTDTMTYEDKMMSMRGNNEPMSKATVFHELIPGHELQGYMSARYRPYRGAALGRSAFVTEGWSLYWELLLWDMKFQKTPEERVGALFWHMHRCARIIFSLSFHLGKMTPDQCINFLVDRVGFERENAVGEVRRSFAGDYGVLYQAGYLLGGMQLYSLHKELVDSGKMTNRQFNDAILKENYIPVEMMRADLAHQPLMRDYKTHWKFYGEVSGSTQ
ncbi:MAG TPA: DUF885 family protein [Bryobacteraceae bacterium]|nr:DUF885 family protein [Bryobacteraceae bacterium]